MSQVYDKEDKQLHVNNTFLTFISGSKNWITNQDCKECNLCTWHQSFKNSICEKCGSKSLSFIRAKTNVYPTPMGPIAYLFPTAKKCWNSRTDPESGGTSSHTLVEELVPVVDEANKEFHREVRCKNCGAVYGWRDGRTATA